MLGVIDTPLGRREAILSSPTTKWQGFLASNSDEVAVILANPGQ